jgi:serine/threonine protein kinase/tetratricopeptide (TPR) repeat protein
MLPFARVESLFHDSLSLPAGVDRDAWIEAQCQGDSDLLREVRSLLEAHAKMEAANRVTPPPAPGIPTASFGPYRATELLGRGGMSSVYLARRADGQFDQTVALKIMAGYLTGPEFLRRFETERQLLASLNHNNITRLLDGGVSSAGDPFLITEYVDGQPIDRWCDDRKLDLKARLRIFLQVCDAVDYAHRNLIVHRDLKPANILVNSESIVKLLDFGTASLLAAQDDVTITRARMLTPRYASPEQLRGERVNIATDVFSLGVVLYELLCGAWPFGDPRSVLSELNRATGTVHPDPPSTVITDESAERRSAPRDQLRRMLKGDLSAIVLKALEQDSGRRYESVRQFATDISGFLAGRPVLARQQTSLYRAGKFIRRRWLPVAAVAVFVLGLTGATFVAFRQERIALARYSDLRSLTTTLLFELKDAINDVPGSTPAQKILVTRVVRSLDSLAGQSAHDPKLQLDLAEGYRQLGELQGSPYGQNLGDFTGALANLSKARLLAQQQLAAEPKGLPPLHAAALVERTTGEVYFGIGHGKDAISHLSAAADLADRMVAFSAAIPELLEAAIIHQVLGDVYGQPGTASLSDPAQASAQYRRSTELDETIVRKDPKMLRARRGIAINHLKLGDLSRFDDPETALDDYRQGLNAFESLPADELKRPANLRFRAQFQRKIGGTLRDLQQWSEAEPYLNRSLAYFEESLAADPDDKRAKFDVEVISEAVMNFYDFQGKTERGQRISERLVSLMDDLIRSEPKNQNWHMTRGYYRYKLATHLAKLGDRTRASAIGELGLNELARVADPADASPQTLQLASEAYSRIEPRTLRNRERAVAYAERFAKLTHSVDLTALYLLAFAQNAEGGNKEAVETARRALALLPPTRDGRVYFVRTELESIH